MRFDCIHCRKATTKPQSVKGAFLRMLTSFLEVLSEKTIERKSKELLAFTTILKYKGLEDNNIILVIPASKIKSSWDNFLFEIYVGMTRAIMNLDIIILKSN